MLMTQLFFCDFNNINNTEETINDELIKLTEWLGCNQLSLNVNKTKFMLFYLNRKAVNYPNLLINNINIENVAEYNFLGIQLNQNLKWTTHQNHVSLKLTKMQTNCFNYSRHCPFGYALFFPAFDAIYRYGVHIGP